MLTYVNKQSDRSPERAHQDYVKAIFQLGRGAPVSGADLARYLAVSRAAVTKSRRALERHQLVKHAMRRTDRIELTERGRDLASKMLRRHRLIETFLHRSLGVPIDRLHAQAEAIEHVISDEVAARLARFLGNPREDPHGHPISSKPHRDRRAKTVPLADAPAGSSIRIESIPDRDAAVVRQLFAQHILPGLEGEVVRRTPLRIHIRSARETHVVSGLVARNVAVTIGKPTRSAR